MELRTERLLLRPYKLADGPQLATGLNDLDVSSWLATVPNPYGLEDAEKFINANMQNSDSVFAVVDESGLVGGIGTRNELGYWIAKPSWGQGYATEAVNRVIRYFFETTESESLSAAYFQGNETSRRILEKAGFTFVADKQVSCAALGGSVTSKDMVLSRNDWQQATRLEI